MILLIPIAFFSGVLTVFSPCVLPILPIILASGIDGNTRRIKGVITGLVISFTVASLLLATLVRVLGVPADIVRSLAVGLLIIFGLSLVFPVIWEKTQAWIESHWKIKPVQSQRSGFAGGFITGVSLGIVWTPCIGPVVAAVATLAAVSSFSLSAVFIALAYALGAGIPLYFIAKGGSKISSRLAVVKQQNQKIRQIFGLIILATALFIWTGADRAFQAWTLENLPESWTQIVTQFEEGLNIEDQIQRLNQSASTSINQRRPVSLQMDFEGAKIAESDLIQGCPGKDCIPSIDQPKFETVEQADSWLEADDLVFGINFQGTTRAYPQKIMDWHEIVNDNFEDVPVAVTFCPLCGSAVAFERFVDGQVAEFGVSGLLHNSDLIMYDRNEGSLWQQITGEAVVGPAARRDERLKLVPIITVPWSQWMDQHPSTQVLSIDTGFSRNYDRYPYGDYEQSQRLLFQVPGLDQTIHIKTVVYGVELGDYAKAYPIDLLRQEGRIEDTIGDSQIVLELESDGRVNVVDLETDESLVPVRMFWFAWVAFYPETELYSLE